VTTLAIVLLVALRISIGWRLLYEGLWKVDSYNTSRPWSAEGYLKNAQGPLRDLFRNMAGDPDELDWLSYDAVAARWDAWLENCREQYDLTDEQWQHARELVDGPPVLTAAMTHDPQLELGVVYPAPLATEHEFAWGEKRRGRGMWFEEVDSNETSKNRLCLDPRVMILPDELSALKRQAPIIKSPSTPDERRRTVIAERFHRALDELAALQTRVAKDSFKIRLRVLLAGDPERAGKVVDDQQGTVDHRRLGDIDKYRHKLERYRLHLAGAETATDQEHLTYDWNEIQQLRAELVGPVKALDDELRRMILYPFRQRESLVTGEKFDRIVSEPQRIDENLAFVGDVPEPGRSVDTINRLTIWGLVVLGVLLIAGLGTRAAAVIAAGMLLSFYLAWPPWPGVPEPPGVSHTFIVNENFITALALLAIAALPTGTWFGVDGILSRLFGRWRNGADTGS
jgi:uncharacterized membrane protein YphA (DoxX/SURF4 family)